MVQDIRTLGLPALLSFRTVAKLGGISAAATELGMAKSGVSRHVTQLEGQLGVRLLERGARSVKLTPVGQKLDDRIRSILAEIDLLKDIAREESIDVSGQVGLAATPEFGSILLTRLLPEIRARHPGLSIAMRTGYAFEDMQDPGTDIAIRMGSFNDDRLVVRQVGSFTSRLVAAPEFLRENRIGAPEDLETVPCLAFRNDRSRTTWRLFGPSGEVIVNVSGPAGTQNFTILRELAISGAGVAALPEFILPGALESGALQHCLPEYCTRTLPVYLAFRPGARQIARIDAAITVIEEILPDCLMKPVL